MPPTLWSTRNGNRRFFLVPEGQVPPEGELVIQSLSGETIAVDSDWSSAFELTEEQARQIAKDQLGNTLDELKTGIDEKLGELRQQLADFNRTPVTDTSAVTPDAASALLDFFKALPQVVGHSISGDRNRVAAARSTMADLQRRLKDAGIDVDDRVKDFPGRLQELRETTEDRKK